jgi:hypothetical protein
MAEEEAPVSIPASILRGGTDIVARDGGGRPPAIGAGPVERIALARPELPCAGCAHAAVCAIRPLLDPDALGIRAAASPHEAIRILPSVRIECSHFLAGPSGVVEPATPTRGDAARLAESRRRGAEAHVAALAERKGALTNLRHGKAARRVRAEAVIAALREHPDDRTAAIRASGLRGPAFAMVLRGLRSSGELPADLRDGEAGDEA